MRDISADRRSFDVVHMEEAAAGRRGLVYFSAAHGHISELFTRPQDAALGRDREPWLVPVDHDVRMLLDVDQGGFDQGEHTT